MFKGSLGSKDTWWIYFLLYSRFTSLSRTFLSCFCLYYDYGPLFVLFCGLISGLNVTTGAKQLKGGVWADCLSIISPDRPAGTHAITIWQNPDWQLQGALGFRKRSWRTIKKRADDAEHSPAAKGLAGLLSYRAWTGNAMLTFTLAINKWKKTSHDLWGVRMKYGVCLHMRCFFFVCFFIQSEFVVAGKSRKIIR